MKCKIDGCETDAMYQKDRLCQKHYFRFMRYGTYDLTAKPRKVKIMHSAGYVLIYMPEHKLANKSGYVYEHRMLMHEKHGDNLPNCELCGKESSWQPYKTHIDHINKIKSDNRLENLRFLCNGCNSQRDVDVLGRGNVTGITIGEETKTAFQWANTEGVFVCGNTILRRLKNGFSHHDSVYSPKRTHNGNK